MTSSRRLPREILILRRKRRGAKFDEEHGHDEDNQSASNQPRSARLLGSGSGVQPIHPRLRELVAQLDAFDRRQSREAVVFECRVGGRIYEELTDGRRFQWGRITGWNAPRSVSFTWHPSREERDAQDVEVRFETDGKQTRVVLTSTGWEKLSPDMQKQRRGYGIGWGAILDVFAGHKGFAFYVFAVLSHSITTFYRITGRLEREIDKAGGRMLPSG
jgi:hypothetical protein